MTSGTFSFCYSYSSFSVVEYSSLTLYDSLAAPHSEVYPILSLVLNVCLNCRCNFLDQLLPTVCVGRVVEGMAGGVCIEGVGL